MLSRSAITSKAQALIKALETSKGTRQKIILKDINELISEHPRSVSLFRQNIKTKLIHLSKDPDESLTSKARQTLALIGHAEPPNAPGIRVLSIDGGGTRGLVSLEILRHIEQRPQRKGFMNCLISFVVLVVAQL